MSKSGPRVLIVDDEPVIADYLAALLEDAGVSDTVCVYDLESATEALDQVEPTLAILDVNIGRALVFPLAQLLREKGVPILFSTGMARAEFPQEWTDAPVLPKPVNPSALLAAVQACGVQSRA